MADVMVNSKFIDNISKGVKTMAGNVATAITSMNKSMGSVKTGQLVKGVTGGLITFELLKKALRGIAESLKDFDKASGGNTMEKVNKGFAQMSVEIGSVLMPYMEKFSSWWADNEDMILTVARRITQVFVGIGSTVLESFNYVSSMLAELSARGLNFAQKAYDKYLSILNFVSGGHWGQLQESVRNEIALTTQQVTTLSNETEQAALKMGIAFASIFSVVPKESGVEAKTKEEVEAIDFLAKYRKDSADRKRKLELVGMESSLSTRDYELAKIKDSYVTQMAEEEAYYQESVKKANEHGLSTKEIKKNHYAAVVQLYSNFIDSMLTATRRMDKEEKELVDTQYAKMLSKDKEYWEKKVNAYWAFRDQVVDIIREQDDSIFGQLSAAQKKEINLIEEGMAQRIITAKEGGEALTKIYRDLVSSVVDSISTANNTFFGALSDLSSYNFEVISREEATRKKIAKNTIKDQAKYEEELAKIESDARAKRIDAKRKELMLSWAMSIANTAQGVTQALAQGGVLGIITGIAVGAAGAIQTGIILDQLNNIGSMYAQGGIVPGTSTTGDKVPARVNSGEMILNQAQQANLFAMANGQGGGGQGIVVHESIVVHGNLDSAAADQVRSDREKQLKALKRDITELKYRGQIGLAF